MFVWSDRIRSNKMMDLEQDKKVLIVVNDFHILLRKGYLFMRFLSHFVICFQIFKK